MKKLPRFTPVIHVTSHTQALEESEVAFSNGADGIFLIDHRRSYRHLIDTYKTVRDVYPSKWIGLNFLDLSAPDAIGEMPSDADALWLDSIEGLDSGLTEELGFIVYAGTAFKYQNQPSDLAKATRDVAGNFGVVTTSGPGTGEAADIQKLKIMRAALGEGPLALASGVTLFNVHDYLPFVDCFLVATGISREFNRLDPVKTRIMAGIIHAH